MTQRANNILLVANWTSDVGYAWWLMENFWVTIATHFQLQGCKSFLIYPEITRIPESIAAAPISVSQLDFRNHRLPNLLRLCRFIKHNSIRHLYLSDAPTKSIYYVLFRICGVRKIVVHDHTPGDRTRAHGVRKLIKQLIQRIPFYSADRFIAVSDFVLQRFINVSCIPPHKCSVAANGIVPIDLTTADRNYAHAMFNIPQDRLIIVNTGRASCYKGIDFFIDVAHQLVNIEGIQNLHFLFCGDGPNQEAFKAQASRYQLDANFTFAGKRDDVRQILPSCDIGFHASKGEVGYSLSILEYMSAGLATLVPDLPSTSGATKHEHNGLIYAHGDIASASTMIKFCLINNIREQLSKNAINDVASHYTISSTNIALISTLEQIFNKTA